MWTRIGLALGVLLCGVAPAFADGFVETSGSYIDGQQIRGNRYDTNGALKVTPATLSSGEDQTNNLLMTSGGAVRRTTIASAVTTNTTSAATTVFVDSKTIWGQVSGTGAVTQTQAIYGDFDNDASGGKLLCTLTLSGTTSASDYCRIETDWPYYYVTTTSTTGTSATGVIYAAN